MSRPPGGPTLTGPPGRDAPHFAEIVRFGVAGIANTAFGFAVYALLILAGSNDALALLAATVVGVFFNFVTFGAVAFRRLEAARLPRFLAAYLVVYGLNLALLKGVQALTPLGPIGAQLGCLIVVAPVAYALLKVKVFQGERR